MSYLGIAYRIAYESKNFRTGLTDVVAMLIKPNGSVIGPIPLTELTGIGFSGVYAYNYHSSPDTDPEGEYIAAIVSPSDNIRDFKRFTLVKRPEASGDGSKPNLTNLVAHLVSKKTLRGSVGPGRLSAAVLKSSRIKGFLPTQNTLKATLKVKTLRGEIK